MPPKAKFTRQEIVDAAVEIARRAPLEAVTAQELASVLGTSTRPVFTYFRTLEEVRAAVVEEAGKIFGRYVERGLSMNPPFKGYGMETIRFAREEPNLFRLLFLRRLTGGEGRHVGEKVVEGVLQHPAHAAHQAGHGAEEIIQESAAEEAVAEQVLHHTLAVGRHLLAVAQLLGALAAKVLFGDLAVDVALIHKGNFILTTMFAFHNPYLL